MNQNKSVKILFQLRSLNNQMIRTLLKTRKIDAVKDGDAVILADRGETHTQGLVVDYLIHSEGPVYQSDFEKKFDMRRSTACRMLQTMEKNGWIERVQSKGDARQKEIIPTDFAKEKHDKIKEEMEVFGKCLTAGISDEDLKTFEKVILKMKANLNEDKKDRDDKREGLN